MVGRDPELRRVPVTVEAHAHVERAALFLQRQAGDIAMAARTGDALGDMNAMVKVREVRQAGHAGPVERSPGLRHWRGPAGASMCP